MKTQEKMTWFCCAVFSLISLSLQQKANLKLEVEPPYIHITNRTPFNLTCTLSDGDGGSVPLAGCGFRHYESGASWDIGTGSATFNNTISGDDTMVVLTNPENEAGMCSLKISSLPKWSRSILGCRVRPVVGGSWIYAAIMVLVDNRSPQQYRLQPPGVLLSLPGSDVTITGEAEGQLDDCQFTLPPNNTEILLDSLTSENTTHYRAWREGMRCGVTLLSVQPQLSGFVKSEVSSFPPFRPAADFVELVVATAPEYPPLLTINSGNFKEAGDILNATCVVKNSRPVANITWLLDGDVIRKDNVNEAPAESAWRWNHEPQTILQRLSRQLTNDDQDKVLTCQAGHIALQAGIQNSNSVTIRFEDPCMSNPCGDDNLCSAVGHVVACSCQTSHVGRWPFCRPECNINSDCPAERACVNQNCRKLCPGDCGQDALCVVSNHTSFCECREGFYGDPYTRCEEEPCGVRNSNPALVSGGYVAKKGEFPWHAAIFEARKDGTHTARCGGTLIRINIVITGR